MSRISRWTVAGIRKYGAATDHRLLSTGEKTLTQMMWARIDVREPLECWPWRGVIKPNGYGALSHKGKCHSAHRLVFQTLVGDIPDGLVIDHLCRNPSCVNPAHLQVTTQAINVTLAAVRRVA